MVFLAINKLLLRKTHKTLYFSLKSVFPSRGPISFFLSRTPVRLVHQDYYHPHDVPAYQTPSLGGDKETAVKVNPEDIIMPMSNIDLRFEESDQPYTDAAPDNPRAAISQIPEMFLPEVPTFFEFWGIYPFVVFAVSFFLSKELYMLLTNGHSSVVTLILTIPAIFVLQQNLSAMFYTEKQHTIEFLKVLAFRLNFVRSWLNFKFFPLNPMDLCFLSKFLI